MKPWWHNALTHGKRGHEMRVMEEEGAGDPLRERHVAMVYTPIRDEAKGPATWDEAERMAEDMARGMAAAPDMARALLKILGTERDDYGRLCVQFDDEGALVAALTKAGVL